MPLLLPRFHLDGPRGRPSPPPRNSGPSASPEGCGEQRCRQLLANPKVRWARAQRRTEAGRAVRWTSGTEEELLRIEATAQEQAARLSSHLRLCPHSAAQEGELEPEGLREAWEARWRLAQTGLVRVEEAQRADAEDLARGVLAGLLRSRAGWVLGEDPADGGWHHEARFESLLCELPGLAREEPEEASTGAAPGSSRGLGGPGGAAALPHPRGASAWLVVGGTGGKGILVRDGCGLGSAPQPLRLMRGARVEQVERRGDRLCFRKLSGDGPREGWVSLAARGQQLLRREPP
ncbi:unnamed protein product [Prorocentrum cordatum]|uniref:Uncharacterized protein n=1 Tax=Prorocentrum cordatum TaxID=2364126 RepID=A0ABN9SMG0_9DINO|nr:unnamed protein product [Polarella glacialis]